MVAIAEDKFLLYQLSAGSTQVTDLCRRGIFLFLYNIFERMITAELTLNKRIVTALFDKNASCLTSFLELLRVKVVACGIKYTQV